MFIDHTLEGISSSVGAECGRIDLSSSTNISLRRSCVCVNVAIYKHWAPMELVHVGYGA